jgi:hypothetical protein
VIGLQPLDPLQELLKTLLVIRKRQGIADHDTAKAYGACDMQLLRDIDPDDQMMSGNIFSMS